MTRPAWLVGVALAGAVPAGAQGVMIAPHAVFIDHRQRSGAVTLFNPGTEPVEISVEVFFGYTTVDSLGNLTLVTLEHPDSSQPSAAGWIQAFPRRVTVGSQERQTVRLLATPPPELPDGEYWARLAFTAKAGQVPVTGVPDTAQIKIGLDLQVRSIIGLWYRKGAARTGVSVSSLQAERQGDTVLVRASLRREGNAAFLGTAHLALANARGRAVSEVRLPVGVFSGYEARWSLPVATLASGTYQLRLVLLTERDDFDNQRVILKAAPVRDSVQVVVP